MITKIANIEDDSAIINNRFIPSIDFVKNHMLDIKGMILTKTYIWQFDHHPLARRHLLLTSYGNGDYIMNFDYSCKNIRHRLGSRFSRLITEEEMSEFYSVYKKGIDYIEFQPLSQVLEVNSDDIVSNNTNISNILSYKPFIYNDKCTLSISIPNNAKRYIIVLCLLLIFGIVI